MLFVKYLSDFNKEKAQELEKKYGSDKDRLKRNLDRMEYIISEDASFDYLVSQKEDPKIGEIINKALLKIEDLNRSKFTGIFNNIDFNDKVKLGSTSTRNTVLKNLLEDFNDPSLNLNPSSLENNDVMGDAYEYLIKNFAGDAGKKGGEFFTPPEVSILISKLVSGRKGVRIYDPTCGSGSLLIKVFKEIGRDNCSIYGQEKNAQTYSLCRMNMYLHEIGDIAKIEWGDTIKEPKFLEDDKLMKFDIVVANPPFSLDKWGDKNDDKYNRFEYGVPPKSKGDYAFVLHMISSMSDNAIAAVVMPHGVLFRGSSEGIIRENIIKDNLLDAVIGLPNNLFYGTSIPACILVFKKDRKERDVLFIDASNECEKGKNQNRLRDEDVEKIYKAYKDRKDIEKYSKVVSLKEIEDNEYNLNIPRYIDSFENEDNVDLKSIREEIRKLEAERESLDSSIAKILKDIKL